VRKVGLNACIPPQLEEICLKCLEIDPSRRFESADALAKALGDFLNRG
jgi:hypothetical protein